MKYGSVHPEAGSTAFHQNGEVVGLEPRSRFSWLKGAAVAVGCGLVFSAVIVSNQAGTDISLASQNTPTLVMDNEHTRRTGRAIGDGKYHFQYIAQVMKETRFQLDTSELALWSVDGTILSNTASDETYYTFNSIGEHQVMAQYSRGVMTYAINVKIVRYEIRDLSDDDREGFFHALRTFYWVDQDEGESSYGSSYKSSDYLVRLHLNGGADRACDHWHDDAGIMNHHIGVTWLFEKSMRMIDPKTAAHYWDYTRDSVYNDEGIGIWFESPIFKKDWFGASSPGNSKHVVDSGRFAYIPVKKDARGFSNITNPYGLLRSPWNTNPTPYVMRHNKTMGIFADNWANFPSCDDFQDVVGDTFAVVSNQLNGFLHGPVHTMTGGHWDYLEKWTEVMESVTFPDNMLLESKFLWRQGFVHVPEVCSADTPHGDCMPYCPSEVMGNATAEELLQKAGFNAVNGDQGLQKAMNAKNFTNEDLLDVICHVGSPGEMFTSAAPQDPLFWPLHGNAERFLQYLRIMKEEGLIEFDETWGYEHMDNLASDTGMVCDWEGVTGMELPTCVRETCPGHKEDDVLPFAGLLESEQTLYSNAEFYALIHPDNAGLPYTYDSLSYWESCTDSTIFPQ